MATQLTSNNPFDTQPPAATNTQPSTGGIVASALPAAGQAMTYKPETRQVNQNTETVQGQVNSILSKDSPLMQRARTLATQGMAQRGLVNSSMNQGAGVAAMTDRALPMAQQDANTYSQAAAENMSARNNAGMFSAGELNKFGMQQSDQTFNAGQANLNRQFQTSERLGGEKFTSGIETARQNFTTAQSSLDRAQQSSLQVGQQEFQAGQQKIQNDFSMRVQQLQESGQDFRQAREVASREAIVQLEQRGITNRFDQELALKSSQFNIEQNNLERRQVLQNQAELERLGLSIKANNQQIPTQFAANISNTTMTGVNAILADGNLTPDAKKGAIDNLVKYANAQIGWAEKFYSATIPPITAPA